VKNNVNDGMATGTSFSGRAVKPNPPGVVSNSGIGKRLLTVLEAAGYLGLQVDTVYKKARLRELPSVKVGRALRFDVKALERFVEQHTIETID
jgi:excisionase family DNA binding protein